MLTIHTYGYIDSLFYTLNAFAMIVNSDLFSSIVKMFLVTGLSFATLKGVQSGNFKNGVRTLITSVILVNVMLLPKASIMIYDHVTKTRDKVDNLPLGFVLPIGVIESLGVTLANKIDQVLQIPGKTYSYLEYGGSFGASLIQQSRNFKIQDPEFGELMEKFLERCVFATAAIGIDFTERDLVKSNNIWSEVIKPNMKDGIREVVLNKKQMGCKTAANFIEGRFKETYLDIFSSLKSTNFAVSGRDAYVDRRSIPNNMDTFFKRNVETVFNDYLSQNTSAYDTIKQVMLLNSFSRFGDYGTLRAIQSQENSFSIAGKIAGTYVPMLFAIF